MQSKAPAVLPRLRTNALWAMLGTGAYAGAQWAMLIVLAKLGSPEIVGQFSLALAVVSPAFLFSNLQLRAIQATDAASSYSFGDYLGLRLMTTAVTLFGLVAWAVLLHGNERGKAHVVVLVAIWKSIEALSDVTFGTLQKHERMRQIALSLVSKGVLSFVLLAGLYWSTRSMELALAGIIIAFLVTLLAVDVPSLTSLGARLVPSFSREKLSSLVKMSLPLGFVTMIASLAGHVPRFFIEHELGAAAVGYFSALGYLVVAGTTIVSAIGQATSPRLARHHHHGNTSSFLDLHRRLNVAVTVLGLAGIAISVVFGNTLLGWLYTPEYANHLRAFQVLMVGAVIGYWASIQGFVLTAMRLFKIQPLLFGVSLVTCILACQALIPRYGLVGGAAALGATYLVQFMTGAVIIHAVRRGRSLPVAVSGQADR